MASPDDALRMAERLAARLTHDLSSGLGVLSMLIELVAEQPADAAEPLALAGETAQQLVARLKLSRAAWGPGTEALDLGALRDLADGLKQPNCAISLNGLHPDTVFPPDVSRMVLNLLMLAGDSLPGGGEIALGGNARDMVVAISGPRAAWPAGLAACLASRTEAEAYMQDARSVQMAFTALLAASLGMRLSVLMPTGAPDRAPPLRLIVS